jgi:hypothetical protein
MQNTFKSLSLTAVWILFLAGCVSFLISPVARYVTGEEFWLWIAVGVSFIALVLALGFIKLVQVLE